MTSVVTGASTALQLLQSSPTAGVQAPSAIDAVMEIANGKKLEEKVAATPTVSPAQSPATKIVAGKVYNSLFNSEDPPTPPTPEQRAADLKNYTEMREVFRQVKEGIEARGATTEEIDNANTIMNMIESMIARYDQRYEIPALSSRLKEVAKTYLAMTPEEQYQFELKDSRNQVADLEEKLLSAGQNEPLAAKYTRELEEAKKSLESLIERPKIIEALRSGELKSVATFDRTVPGVQRGQIAQHFYDVQAETQAIVDRARQERAASTQNGPSEL